MAISQHLLLRNELGFKGEEFPVLPVFLDRNGMSRLARKPGNGTCPKMVGGNIRLHHANFPLPGKPPPQLMGYLNSKTPPAVSANHEELRHVPDSLIPRHPRPSLH